MENDTKKVPKSIPVSLCTITVFPNEKGNPAGTGQESHESHTGTALLVTRKQQRNPVSLWYNGYLQVELNSNLQGSTQPNSTEAFPPQAQ
jgi:hypothetical protein